MILSGSKWIEDLNVLDPLDFKITSGMQTNLRRAVSGKLWGQSIRKRDTLTLNFDKMTPEMGTALQQWLYNNSRSGWQNDAYAFILYAHRQGSSLTAPTDSFKGKVIFQSKDMTLTLGNFWASPFSLDFKILQYLSFQ